MSTTMTSEMEREEIEMLLPWFVTGKLPPDDKQRVEAYLAAHPDMRRQIDLVDAELTGTTANNEAMGSPSADALHRLMDAIENRSLAHRTGLSFVSGAVQSALDWLSQRSALVPVTAAVAVALLVQAGVIGALVWHGTGSQADFTVKTASAPKAASELAVPGTFVLVGLAPTATAQDIEKSLQPLGISIVDGPRPGGIYRLRLSDKTLSEAERDMLTTALKANAGLVKFVAPAGP